MKLTLNVNTETSNGTPMVLEEETKRFLVETIAGMVEGSLANIQRSMADMANDITALSLQNTQMENRGPQLNHSRMAKIEFPKFSGEDVKGWVFRCEQFFLLEQTPDLDKNMKYETTAREYEDAFDSLLSRVEEPLISLNALTGTNNFKAMRVIGTVVTVVPDGNKLVTTSECKQFKWQFGPNFFSTDVMLLPYGGCDMGTNKSNLEWLKIKAGNKTVRKAELHSMAICVFPNADSTCMQMEETATLTHPVLQQVVEEYEDVFAIPTELPPKRDHDHKIPLIGGAQPVNIRPYRHPPT
ncbi:hypothetical protein Tco_0215425 [Tanacetum coccineum]